MPPSTSLAALRTAPSSLTAFHPRPSPPPPLLSRTPTTRWPPPLRARASGQPRGGSAPSDSALDALLSAAELLCLGPPAICSVVCAVRLALPSAPAKPALTFASGRVFVAQYALLIAAVAIGSLIRRRQLGRLCRVGGGEAGELDLVGRIGKVEESVRGAVAAVGVLSRSVEKLGVRFRAMRRTLTDPIMETATLAQKNSEATRILAAQEVILEKELGEIQKVLFAMQEQQQKQLQLILAIGEASRMLDGKQDTVRSSSAVPEMEKKEVKINAESINGGNNKP